MDTILMEYLLYCERHNIRFTVVADCKKLDFMSEEDIYSLFSNLISNAIEGAQTLVEKEKRVISLVVREQTGVLSIRLENYFGNDLVLKDGIPVTTKQDTTSHGFGTKSIMLLCEKYGGVLHYDIDGDIFRASAIFPIA
jgi:sensor histidine kinase regulating citrate/malate metabolism